MGNEASKKGRAGTNPLPSDSVLTGESKKENSIKDVQSSGERRKRLQMDESSAHTFAPNAASSSVNSRRGASSIMITDALSDVRANYHIDPKELGHGHYGVVRKCMHRERGDWYAIKSIRKSKVSKIEVLKREIEILKEVKHPNIIELVEVYEDERYLHLITEICSGGELFDRIIAKTQSSEGHFSEHDAAVLVRDILDAICYCHLKGIVHRDLKPENFLFLTNSENAPIKIIDFGLSRHDDSDLGIMKTKVGTPYYVAPEVLRREYTKSCDIWSIGVITYILLCGYPPFYGDSDMQIFESVKIGKFDFPSPEWDNISRSAKDFIISLLKKNPKDRPTAEQALKSNWLREQLGHIRNSSISQVPSRRPISHASSRTSTFTKYLAMKKLKKAALGYIASNLTHDEVGALEELFRSMDGNGDGSITLNELDRAIQQGNFARNLQVHLKKLRRDFALSGEDKMNWRDFVAATMDRSLAMRDDNMRMAFEHFKHAGSETDYLTLSDLSDIIGDETQAREIMALLDLDGNGEVSFENFCHVMAESMDNDSEDEDFTT